MSDQLSKVDKPAPNWCPRCHKRPDDVTFCTHEFHRIESDAAPVEVDHFAASWRGDWNSTMRGYAEEYARRANATLARQLAEAKAGRLTLTQDYCDMRDRAEQAESQLAEATRRLGEVEGLVGKWRECAEDNAARGELIQAGKAVAYTDCADELEAALTKEPTK